MSSTSIASYAIIKINSLAEAQEVGTRLSAANRIFRGHRDATWHIESTLERDARLSKKSPLDREREILEQVSNDLAVSNKSADFLDLLHRVKAFSLLQHYFAATRLVDFTKSFYKALFFALRTDTWKGESAVFAINRTLLVDNVVNELGALVEAQDPSMATKFRSQVASHPETAQQASQSMFDKLLRLGPLPAVPCDRKGLVLEIFPLDLPYLNQRITAQEGLFLTPLNLHSTSSSEAVSIFEWNLLQTLGLAAGDLTGASVSDYKQTMAIEQTKVLKIVFPPNIHQECRDELHKQGVDEHSLKLCS